MNRTYKKLAISLASLFLFSCSNDSSTTKDESFKDDFSYLTVNSSGEINKIGNNSGKISSYSKFDGLIATPLNLSTVTSNTDEIFLIEYYEGISKLLIFDKKTKKTSSKALVFPNEIIGSYPSISSLTWDESKKILYGIVVDNIYNTLSDNLCYFIKINPNTFEISYSDVSFKEPASISTFLNGNKLYSSYPNKDTYEIDTEKNTAKKVLFNNTKFWFIRPAISTNNIAFCITNKEKITDYTIVKVNLTNNTYEDLLPNESLGYSSQGAGYMDSINNEYICYSQRESDKYFLLKFNIITNTYKYFELKSDSLIDTNFVIVDKVN